MKRSVLALVLVALMVFPLAGSIAAPSQRALSTDGVQLIGVGQTTEVPLQAEIWWDTTLD